MIYKYGFVDPKYSQEIDLRDLKKQIKRAVFDLFGENITAVVYKDYFVLNVKEGGYSNGDARKLGKKISEYCPKLHPLKKVYKSEKCENGESVQRFKRKR